VTIVHNKIDLAGVEPGVVDGDVYLSAHTGEGVDALRQRILELAGYDNQGEGAFTARRRHIGALRRAKEHFETGCRALDESKAGELLAEELRLSQQALGEITGAFSADDLLGKIFSEFCIGK
jgi:tRNA modification GTPase